MKWENKNMGQSALVTKLLPDKARLVLVWGIAGALLLSLAWDIKKRGING